jgi:hypothetical protein
MFLVDHLCPPSARTPSNNAGVTQDMLAVASADVLDIARNATTAHRESGVPIASIART